MKTESEHIDDKLLWEDFKKGDKSSFNTLFRKYYSELYYYGIKIYANSALVEECIQEVFIRVWETRESLSEVQYVRSYLFISLRRMILLRKDKEKKKQNVEIENAEKYAFFFEENEFVKHEEISDDTRQILIKAINSLTKKQREIVMLFFYHELSYAEISKVIGISVPAARNLMYRTLMQLRKTLGNDSLNSTRNMFFLLFSSVSEKK